MLYLAILTACAAGVANAAGSEYLLPGDVAPRHYDLKALYDVDPKTRFAFYAVVDILLTVKSATSKIVMHAENLTVASDKVILRGQSDASDPPKVTKVQLNSTFDFLTVFLDNDLIKDENYTLTIPFNGNLKRGLNGVYISSYDDKTSKTEEYLVTTQFEAIHARKGFPCFDEPMYKATYRISLGHNKDFVAVSNMPLEKSSNENALEDFWPWSDIETTFNKSIDKFTWSEFVTSVPMSTYLVAFVISRFSHVVSPSHLSNTTFRIWARNDAVGQTAYAAEIGPKVLTYFENFFNVSFPLPKQDMFAIPDFSAGAMENWGLITYRETALLYDEEQSSFLNKARVSEVIAHELAHQWFGNLVTMKWWSDLWLNEGFATYVGGSLGVNAVEPTWNVEDSQAAETILSVLELDALKSSHPVSVPLDHPRRIDEIFDDISYRKGSALIRMMTKFLGVDVFRKALHNYLVKHSYSNADQDDLWRELNDVSDQTGGLTAKVTVKEVMDTWTKQTGFPLLTATRNYDDKTVSVSQKRYLALSADAPNDTAVSWWVPLTVLCEPEVGAKPSAVQWLSAAQDSQDNQEGAGQRFGHASNSEEWVLFNHDMIAPYRVNYDTRNWLLLTSTLMDVEKMSKVPVLARVQLLSDAFALSRANKLNYSIPLELTNYLEYESEYLPLSTGLNALGKIETVLKRSSDYGAFQKLIRRLITKQYHKAGGLAEKKILNPHDLKSVKLQTMTSSWACSAKVPGCEENAIELFQSWMEDSDPDQNNPIPLDLRRTVYCVSISRGSVAQWRFALERMRAANVAAAREALLSALTCTREVWILNQFLEWAITEGSVVRSQDAPRVITSITTSTVGYYVARDFIYTRIADIHKNFSGQSQRIGSIVRSLLSQFTTQIELDEFLRWRESNAKYLEDATLVVEQAIENAKINIDWVTRHKAEVVAKLREFST